MGSVAATTSRRIPPKQRRGAPNSGARRRGALAYARMAFSPFRLLAPVSGKDFVTAYPLCLSEMLTAQALMAPLNQYMFFAVG